MLLKINYLIMIVGITAFVMSILSWIFSWRANQVNFFTVLYIYW